MRLDIRPIDQPLIVFLYGDIRPRSIKSWFGCARVAAFNLCSWIGDKRCKLVCLNCSFDFVKKCAADFYFYLSQISVLNFAEMFDFLLMKVLVLNLSFAVTLSVGWSADKWSFIDTDIDFSCDPCDDRNNMLFFVKKKVQFPLIFAIKFKSCLNLLKIHI